MSGFFLEKNIAKIGETVGADGVCIDGGDLESSDQKIAIVDGKNVKAVGIGEATIGSGSTLCNNSIIFTVTDDGEAPFMAKNDYVEIQTYEMLFVGFFIFVVFLINFTKNV